MTPEDGADPARAVVALIRQASAAGRPIGAREVLEGLRAGGFAPCPEASPEADSQPWLAAVLSGQPGIASFAGLSGQVLYHDPALLSRTYARILDRKGSPVALVAEEIRANSRDYPRPVPVTLFAAPPFDLTPQALDAARSAMAASPEYDDIASVTTSTGAVYLFSTRHLERPYAAFLAEQHETFAQNP
ncbi:MAG: hypothetical protein ACP59X_07170 [Solidesulfovibrio sp. DCME]|uniref:hypothetical protein n=1 Tax=Solidesulfovibrio sp. DCME TaxID=3447380 RepID=UPI003D0F7B94